MLEKNNTVNFVASLPSQTKTQKQFINDRDHEIPVFQLQSSENTSYPHIITWPFAYSERPVSGEK